MRIFLAIRTFFAVLFRRAVAEQVRAVLAGRALPAPPVAKAPERERPAPAVTERPKKPVRSDGLTLLATLQREARLVDLVQESLDEYSDEQVGAAARDVLRNCRSVLERLFQLQPVVREPEGAEVALPAGFDAGRYRLTGDVSGAGPLRGSLMHHGWEATKCEIPAWSGSEAAARVVAPAEVEVRP